MSKHSWKMVGDGEAFECHPNMRIDPEARGDADCYGCGATVDIPEWLDEISEFEQIDDLYDEDEFTAMVKEAQFNIDNQEDSR